MVQLSHTADPHEIFPCYVWVTGTSSTARNQAYRFRDGVLDRLTKPAGKSYVFEVASNDGTYLKPFMEKGFDVLGVDPAANIVERAMNNGIPTRCNFFGEEVAKSISAEKGFPDVVFARNVLAHVADLHDFVKGFAHLIGDNGLGVIEFHYGLKILEGLQYDSIYHEHLCYITAQSISNLLEQFDIDVVDFEEGPISGGALIVYVRKRGAKRSVKVGEYLDLEKQKKANSFDTWKKFGEDVSRHRDLLLALLDSELKAGRKVVGYGASARSSTLLNYCGITGDRISVIADQNDLKHGKFTAGSCIPILLPDDVLDSNPETILILSWNFLDEIVGILTNKFKYKGRIVVPLPNAPRMETAY